MSLHWIQNEILHSLIESDGLSFSALRPENLENDQYNYHLKKLISLQFVAKVDGVYSMTPQGKIAFNRTDGAGKAINQPKLGVLIKIRNQEDKYFLIRRESHPFKGIYMFPTVRFASGANPLNEASDLAQQHLGAKPELSHEGFIRRVFQPQQDIIDDRMFMVFAGLATVDNDRFFDVTSMDQATMSLNVRPIVDQLPGQPYVELIDKPGQDPRF